MKFLSGKPACADHDPAYWDWDIADGGTSLDLERARTVCATCPVQYECLNMGLEPQFINYQILGGLTPPERQLMRRRNNRHAAKLAAPTERVTDDDGDEQP